MLAKSWKKIGIIILIIACLINIGHKLATKISFNDVIAEIKNSFNQEKTENNPNNN